MIDAGMLIYLIAQSKSWSFVAVIGLIMLGFLGVVAPMKKRGKDD